MSTNHWKEGDTAPKDGSVFLAVGLIMRCVANVEITDPFFGPIYWRADKPDAEGWKYVDGFADAMSTEFLEYSVKFDVMRPFWWAFQPPEIKNGIVRRSQVLVSWWCPVPPGFEFSPPVPPLLFRTRPAGWLAERGWTA